MPKIHGTKKEKAEKLLDALSRGPGYSKFEFEDHWEENKGKQPWEIAQRIYSSWVMTRMEDLEEFLPKKFKEQGKALRLKKQNQE